MRPGRGHVDEGLSMLAVEIFSCMGGMAEGFRRAGLTFDVAVDKDPDARASYLANMGHMPLDLDVKDTRRTVARLRELGRIDLLVADPPCIAWSYSGKKEGVRDPRDCLLETCWLIGELRPRAWMIANVPGLEMKKHRDIVDSTIGAIPGYHQVYGRFDAADYGVPQHRRRPFWIGLPADTKLRLKRSQLFEWPKPTHCDPKKLALLASGEREDVFGELLPWVTCRQALGHLPLEGLGRPIHINWPKSEGQPSELDSPARTVQATRNGSAGGHLSMPRAQGNRFNLPEEPARTLSTRARKGQGDSHLLLRNKHPVSRPDEPGYVVSSQNRPHNGGNCLEWPWDRPSTSVAADPLISQPGKHVHVREPNAVVLSQTARLILQGFPESWTVCGKTKTSRDSQIGQAMPPPLAEAVARAILAVL